MRSDADKRLRIHIFRPCDVIGLCWNERPTMKSQTPKCADCVSCRAVPTKVQMDEETPARFTSVSRCVRLCQERRKQTRTRAEGGFRAGFERLVRDERRGRIKNRRQVRRPVRSLLPAVRAVTGGSGEFQSGVKIEGVIWLLRSSSPIAYSHKKKAGVMPWKRCYREQKRYLPLCRTPERKMPFL